MFEKIGRFVVGYVIFMFIVTWLVAAPTIGVLLLVLVVAAWLLRRAGAWGGTSGATSALLPAALPYAQSPEALTAARLQAVEQRLEQEGEALERQLPADPMDNPMMVELCSAYLHDPAERDHIEAEYQARRNDLLRWQVDLRRLSRRRSTGAVDLDNALPQEYERLSARLAELQAYVEGLPARAAQTRVSVEQALAAAARATSALDAARAAYAATVATHAMPGAADQIRAAEEKLRQADAALQKDDEQPLAAARLAAEAERLAGAVRERTLKLASLPVAIAQRAAEFDAASARVGQEIARAREAFDTVAGQYAPSCWLDIRGAGAAAERAAQQAGELRRMAGAVDPAVADAAALETAAKQLADASALLDQASGLAKTITDHIKTIETAALTAREKVAAAEAEADRAWAWVQTSAGKDAADRAGKLLERAAELAAQARTEMGSAQPDWLAIAGWAERSADLAAQVRTRASALDRQAADLRQTLKTREEQTKIGRDRAIALSWGVAATGLTSATRVRLDQAEAAYQRAVQLAAAIEQAAGDAGQEQAIQAAIAAFQQADVLVMAAYTQVQQEIAAATAPKGSAKAIPLSLAGGLVWGALGAVGTALDKDS